MKPTSATTLHVNSSRQGIVLALGGSSARGLAHIGVLEVLEREHIPVRAIVGTSIGAEIGAFYCAGVPITEIVRLGSRMDWLSTLRLFLPDFQEGGISTGKGIRSFLKPWLGGIQIEELETGFAAITTDLLSGEEVVLKTGNLLEAVRASIAVPGLLSPVQIGEQMLVDGGLVNPVPFDTARQLFAGPVIAVAVHPLALRDSVAIPDQKFAGEQSWDELAAYLKSNGVPYISEWLRGFKKTFREHPESLTDIGISDVYQRSVNIAQAGIVRIREQISPPDLMLKPDVRQIGMLEFQRGKEAIAQGRKAAEDALGAIHLLLENGG